MRFFASLISKILMAKIRNTIIKSKLSSHFFLRSSGNQTRNSHKLPTYKTKNRLEPFWFKAIVISTKCSAWRDFSTSLETKEDA